MITVAPKITSPPEGSIYLDDLIKRYLPAIGFKRFNPLQPLEIDQFVLMALSAAFDRYAPEEFSVEFWDRRLLGEPCRHICLVPDTDEGREYAAGLGETALVLRSVKNVKSLMSRIFIRLIAKDLKSQKRQRETEQTIFNIPPSRRRRKTSDKENPSLEEYARSQARECLEAEEAEARFIRDKVFEKMRPRQVRAVEMIIDGKKRNEVAEHLSMSAANVDKIVQKFQNECKKMRSRIKARSQHSRSPLQALEKRLK